VTKNKVQELREAQVLSKSELARKAGVSTLTVERVEKGLNCRVDTKRKILLALGLKTSERKKVFIEDNSFLDTEEEHPLQYNTPLNNQTAQDYNSSKNQ
jgi:DNA-binding XRE family transcriptional regulator